MDTVFLSVPASSANVGLGYDIWCLGLESPRLRTTAVRLPGSVEVTARSPVSPPEGRQLGYAGRVAARHFLNERHIGEGLALTYEDDGYPVGGLGRSGAEAVGGVLAAAILFGQRLTREETIAAAARAEPGEHMDNVAGSANGKFSIIARSPASGAARVDVYDPPQNLGIAIAYSSHVKAAGTEGLRQVLSQPITTEDFVAQSGALSAATAAMVSGNTERFLDLVWADRFQEPRRADAGGYGGFTALDLQTLKRRLFVDHHVALTVSGAGPNLQLLYSTWEHPDGLEERLGPLLQDWFCRWGVRMRLQTNAIAKEGAFDVAVREYGL